MKGVNPFLCVNKILRWINTMKMTVGMHNETVALHGGYEPDPTTGAVAVPIYQTAAYAFDSAEHAAALFNLEAEGFRYSRISNPTNAVLERRVAELEGGVDALSVGSGQAALTYALLNVAEAGRNIVSVPQLYGTTHTLLAHLLPKWGIGARFAASDCPADVEAEIDGDTRAIFCESVGNPAGNVADLTPLAEIGRRHGLPLIVDNTVATPVLLRPIEYGAHIVVHSLTKFMGGHGTTLGGIVVDGGTFPWQAHAQRFPQFSEPDLSYHGLVYAERFGRAAYPARLRSVYLRTTGVWIACSSGSRALWLIPAGATSSCETTLGSNGSTTPAFRSIRTTRSWSVTWAAGPARS